MPRNFPNQYKPRTYAAYTAAMDAAVALPVGPASPPAYPLTLLPTGFTLTRITRLAWSLSGATGAYMIRVLELSATSLGAFLPAPRRIVSLTAGTLCHRGPLVLATPAAGPQIWATWLAAGITQNAEGAEQEAVLENPIELQAGRGLGIEVTTLIGGDAAIEAYVDFEEFQ